MDLDKIRRKYLKDMEHVETRNQTLDERTAIDYIENMAHVLCVIDKNLECIRQNSLDIKDLKHRRGNSINFRFNIGEKEFRFRYDVEFALFLPERVKKFFLDSVREFSTYFSLENRRAYITTKNSSAFQRDELAFPGGSIFRAMDLSKREINKTINDANNFKLQGAPKVALNVLNTGYVSPNRAIFLSLYIFFAAIDETNPNRNKALACFNNYFHGSISAYENALRANLEHIMKDSKRIDINAKWIYKSKIKKKVKEKNGATWQGDFIDFASCLLDFGGLSDEAKYWLQLQRTPFTKIQENYRCEKFRVFKKRIEKSVSDPRNKVHHLVKLLFSVTSHVNRLTDPGELPQTTLNLDFSLSLITNDEYNDYRDWIWNNRLELIDLMKEIVETIRAISDTVPLPKGVEKIIQTIEANMQEPVDKLSDKLNEIKMEAAKVLSESIPQSLVEQICYRDKIKASFSTLDICEPGVLGCMIAAYESGSFMPEVRKRMDLVMQLMERLSIVEDAISDSYLNGKGVLELSRANQASCLELFSKRVLINFNHKDFTFFTPEFLKQRFEMFDTKSNVDRVKALEIVIDEFYSLPSEDDIELYMESIDPSEKSSFMKQVSDHYKRTKIEIRRLEVQFLELIQELEHSHIETRMKAFGLRYLLPSHIRKVLSSCAIEVNRVEVAKISSNPDRNVEKLKNIESSILELQRLYHTDHAEDLVSLLQSRLKVSVKTLFADIFIEDMKGVYENCIQYKKEIDALIFEIKKEENRLGTEENIDHYSVSLNVNDLDDLRANYSLSDGTNQDDLKLFCYLYNQKKKLMDNEFKKAIYKTFALKEIGGDSCYRKLQTILKRHGEKHLENCRKKRKYDPTIKAYLLFENKVLLELEAKLLCLYLNFCNELEFKTKQIYLNFIKIFMTCQTNHDPEIKKVVARIRKVVLSELEAYKPRGREIEFSRHVKAFKKEIYEITFNRVSYDL